MQITVSRNELGAALGYVKTALATRPAIPIMGGVRLEVSKAGFLGLAAFDYDQAIRAGVGNEGGQPLEPGEILVDGKALAKLVSSLPKTKATRVTLSASDPAGFLEVRCGDTLTTLRAMPFEEYPQLPALPPSIGIADGDTFARAVARVAPCVTTDETLPVLLNVNIQTTTEGVTFAANDRYRLAEDMIDWVPTPVDESDAYTMQAPAKELVRFAKLCPGHKVTIHFKQPVIGGDTETRIGFSVGGYSLVMRQGFGEFPSSYRILLDGHKSTGSVRADGPQLAAVVKRALAVIDRAQPVYLDAGDGKLTVTVDHNYETGLSEAVPAEIDGELARVSVNATYLHSLVTALDGDGVLTWSEPGKTLKVEPVDDDHYRGLMMTLS